MMIDLTERDSIFGFTDNNSPRWRSKEQKLKTFSGNPCDRCGDDQRFTNVNNAGHHNGDCMTCRAESRARRRAAKLQRTPSWLTEEHKKQICLLIIKRDRVTRETGIPHHLDHIVPLQGVNVSGLHVPWNMQVLPESENCSKSNFFES